MTNEERYYFSRVVGHILTCDECEEITERIKELEEEIADGCEDEPYSEYVRGIGDILEDYM